MVEVHQKIHQSVHSFIDYTKCVTVFLNQTRNTLYHRGGKFGWGKVWLIESFQAFGKRKFCELIDQPIDY